MFLKGILIGLIFGVPVGAVRAMTVQRTWDNTKASGWLVVLGVFVGTCLWWGGLAAAAALARKKKRTDSFRKINRIFGVVLSLFGILVFIRAIPI